jgi:hypothetical protein
LLEKNRPIHIASFGGWLNYPDYYFFWGYHGQNALFDTMSYQNPAMDKLIDGARFETDPRSLRRRSQEIHRYRDGGRTAAFPSTSRSWLSECKRTSSATPIGSTVSSTSASSKRAEPARFAPAFERMQRTQWSG